METTINNNTVILKNKKAVLVALHYQGNDWKRLLDFYIIEITLLEDRASAKLSFTDENTPVEINRFVTAFALLKNKIDLLKQEIQKDEEVIQKLVYENACHIKRYMLATDNKKLSRVKDIGNGVTALQFAFNQFITQNI